MSSPDPGGLRRHLTQALIASAGQSVLFRQALADRVGLNATDLACAGILSESGRLTAGRLAEVTGLTTGAVTGVVDRLERAGYVRRTSDPEDRRRVIVEPVPGQMDRLGRTSDRFRAN